LTLCMRPALSIARIALTADSRIACSMADLEYLDSGFHPTAPQSSNPASAWISKTLIG
jgi:hypothetical protein